MLGFSPANATVTISSGVLTVTDTITVAAAEVALGVPIVIAIYRNRQTVFVTDANQMRH